MDQTERGDIPARKYANFRIASKIVAKSIIHCAKKTIIAPLDRIRTIYQFLPLLQQQFVTSNGVSSQVVILPDNANQISSIQLGKLIVKENGVTSLWDGNLYGCLSVLPNIVVDELIAPKVRTWVVRQNPKENYIGYLFEELLEELLVSTIKLVLTHPLITIQIRVQQNVPIYNSISGAKSLYRCIPLALVGAIAQKAIFVSLTELFRRYATQYNGKDKPISAWQNWILRFLCTQLSWVLTFPIDTICRCSMGLDLPIRRTYFQIIAQSGYSAFFNGLGTHLALGTVSGLTLIIASQIRWGISPAASRKRKYKLLRETH